MTHAEFASWLKGINVALNGEPPPKPLWQKIMDEATKLAAPYVPVQIPSLDDYFKKKWDDQPPYKITCDDRTALSAHGVGAVLDRGDRDAR